MRGVLAGRSPGAVAFAAVIVVLFLLGFVGWLVQGAGDDDPVPTVPPTTAPAPTSTR